MPLIGVGRTNDIVWSFTTPNIDTSDLWQERVSKKEAQYYVETVKDKKEKKWETIQTERVEIGVKGRKEKVIYDIKRTHRGPLFSFDSLQLNSMMLFGKKIASLRNRDPAHSHFSFAW